jgi:hypothetical protein
MVILSEFKIERKGDSLFVRSHEVNFCPVCGGSLRVIGSRGRSYVKTNGNTVRIVIRRLRCNEEKCNRIHHELPNTLVPYKRHCSLTIERAVTGIGLSTIYADISAVRRIRIWFRERLDYIYGELLHARSRLEGFSEQYIKNPSVSKLKRIHNLVGSSPGWLKQVVRILVNNSRWLHTRMV